MEHTGASINVTDLLKPKNAQKLKVDMEGYEFYIVRDWYNPLVKRREVSLVALHIGKSTPSRMQLRYKLAKAFNTSTDKLFVRSIKSEYGVGRTRIEVHIYDDAKRALEFEPKYIIERNKLPEEE